jgi:competence protein ComGC
MSELPSPDGPSPEAVPPAPDQEPLAEGAVAEPPARKPRIPWWVRGFFYLLIIGLLAAIAIPNFVKSRTTACNNSCISNLKQIDGANQQWALENKKLDSDIVDAKASIAYLKGGVAPTCPAGGSYTIAVAVSNAPTCSLSATLGHSLP